MTTHTGAAEARKPTSSTVIEVARRHHGHRATVVRNIGPEPDLAFVVYTQDAESAQ